MLEPSPNNGSMQLPNDDDEEEEEDDDDDYYYYEMI